jgi:hypothetical protein
MPSLPLHEAGPYVAAAYLVLFALVLIYVTIMAVKLSRIERELGELTELVLRKRDGRRSSPPAPGELDAEQLSAEVRSR